MDQILLRMDVRMLNDRVQELEESMDINKVRILHAYNHLEETLFQV